MEKATTKKPATPQLSKEEKESKKKIAAFNKELNGVVSKFMKENKKTIAIEVKSSFDEKKTSIAVTHKPIPAPKPVTKKAATTTKAADKKKVKPAK